MNIRQNRSLHFLLIILLIFAPLRSVFAMQLMVCDMNISSGSVEVPKASSDHCRHVLNEDSADTVRSGHQVKSCCSSNGACMSDCHVAVSASLFIQHTDYSPLLLDSGVAENIPDALLVRELNPLSKPPQSLYS